MNRLLHQRSLILLSLSFLSSGMLIAAPQGGSLSSVQDFKSALSRHKMAVVLFYSGDAQNTERILKAFSEVGSRDVYRKARITFFSLDIKSGDSLKILQDLHIHPVLPAVILYQNGNPIRDQVLRDSISRESIANLIDDNFGDAIEDVLAASQGTDEAASSNENSGDNYYYYYYGYPGVYPYATWWGCWPFCWGGWGAAGLWWGAGWGGYGYRNWGHHGWRNSSHRYHGKGSYRNRNRNRSGSRSGARARSGGARRGGGGGGRRGGFGRGGGRGGRGGRR